jgi:hypothetical protein
VSGKRKGKVVLLHLAVRYPFAGVVWQLLHHLVGFRQLGCDVYYLEDNRAYVYDPVTQTPVADAQRNLKLVGPVLDRFGFRGKWAFLDPVSEEYFGMDKSHCAALLREADAVINLCGASNPGEEHIANKCLVYLETDPGLFQVKLARRDPEAITYAAAQAFLHLRIQYRRIRLPAPHGRRRMASYEASCAAWRVARRYRAKRARRVHDGRYLAQHGQRCRNRQK